MPVVRFSRTQILPFAIFLLLRPSPARPVEPGKAGTATAAILDFGGGWTRKTAASNIVISQPASYDIRQRQSGGLLFALRDATGDYGDQYYAVEPPYVSAPSLVSRDDWERGSPVRSAELPLALAPSAHPKTIRFKEKDFERSGDFFPASAGLPSPDGRVLAVFSYSSRHKATPGFFGFLGGGEPSQGRMFVDLYAVAGGEKILTCPISYSGFGPSILFGQARWITQGGLVMPIDFLSRRALLIILDQSDK